MRIGVLALQGDFAKHLALLRRLGVEGIEVRRPEELDKCDGLIIPGGESTTMLRQIAFIGLREPLHLFAAKKPVFGTCAGMILMSKEIVDGDSAPAKKLGPSQQQPFGWLDIGIQRNGFGRQVDSFQTTLSLSNPSLPSSLSALFIRAPRVRRVGPGVMTLASYLEEPVLLQQGHHLAASFHPELTDDPTVHLYFMHLVEWG